MQQTWGMHRRRQCAGKGKLMKNKTEIPTVTVTLTRSELVSVPLSASVSTPFFTYGCRLYDCLRLGTANK